MDAEEIFDLALSLGEHRNFSQEGFHSLTGISLRQPSEWTGGSFAIYRSGEDCGHPWIKDVELRTPAGGDRSTGLLIIEIKDACEVTGADVIARFGQPTDISVPYPEQPPEDPVRFSYVQDWGRLVFGISRQEPECLREIILEISE